MDAVFKLRSIVLYRVMKKCCFVWGDGFMGTQTHLPPKFSFSSDFGHFILKMVEVQNFHMCQEK